MKIRLFIINSDYYALNFPVNVFFGLSPREKCGGLYIKQIKKEIMHSNNAVDNGSF